MRHESDGVQTKKIYKSEVFSNTKLHGLQQPKITFPLFHKLKMSDAKKFLYSVHVILHASPITHPPSIGMTTILKTKRAESPSSFTVKQKND